MFDIQTLPSTLEEILSLPRVHFRDRGHLPSRSGVYFILYESGLARLAYIGKAENFQKRWVGHHRLPECQLLDMLGIPIEIAWSEVPLEYLRNAEDYLIKSLLPPLNDRISLGHNRRRLSIPRQSNFTNASEILSDFDARKEHAFELLQSEELWDQCNDEDGDLLCVWPFPNGIVLCDVNYLFMYEDSHDLYPSRVPYPPKFRANHSGIVQPKVHYAATTSERQEWTRAVARQVDSFLLAIASTHGASVNVAVRREVLGKLATTSTLEEIIREQ